MNSKNFKMKNLRKVGKYNIGLDIGTASVGWAVTDMEGNLCKFNGRPTWGSRLFSSAQPASEARNFRGQRRRVIRKRWRLGFLQDFFKEDVEKVDPNFFYRLNNSKKTVNDRDFSHPLFNKEFAESKYYQKFPTIYHLRKYLCESTEKEDIRLIYLALHNIVKHRGHFLREGSFSSKNSDIANEVQNFIDALQEWCENNDIECIAADNADLILAVMRKNSIEKDDEEIKCKNPSDKQRIIKDFLFQSSQDNKPVAVEISKAIVGLTCNYAKVFEGAEVDASNKFSFSDEEKVEAFVCPEGCETLFASMKSLFSAYVLQDILSSAPGETISACKVADYDTYEKQLKILKRLVREYIPDKYNDFFRGPFYPGTNKYDVSKAKGYTRYNLGVSKIGSNPSIKQMDYDDFKKAVEKLFAGTDAVNNQDYIDMMDVFSERKFLRRQKTSDNGAIPHQLHLEEMKKIIDNQSKYYSFLKEDKEKLLSLVTFRIPYYIGPLTELNAATDSQGDRRFSWSKRNKETKYEKITPWNWDKVIDKVESAKDFITRMTGTCTYLYNEPVLPKCSLLYEEFCVLNELNGAWMERDGRKERFFGDEKIDIFNMFRQGTVTYKKIEDYLCQNKIFHTRVGGGQGANKFESRLSSYIFFCKDVFNFKIIPESYKPDIERIIEWNTVYEDRSILKERLQLEYQNNSDKPFNLSDEQIKKICKKRFTGWGRLSKKLLVDLKDRSTDFEKYSIMDVLRDGDPLNRNLRSSNHGTMIFQEIIKDDELNFKRLIDEDAESKAKDILINELPGSPALRRGINQSLRIVKEIQGITKEVPQNIYIEVAREDDTKKKGTRTETRKKQLKEALDAFKKQCEDFDPQVLKELQGKDKELADEKLMLYFMQNGKSLYSGRPLDINRLSEYQVDHIIPQMYIKDDSLDNKALVLPEENQSKKDDLLIDDSIRRKMKSYWSALHDSSKYLMSDKKYNNLMCSQIGERKMKGFINRQIVETSQIIKFVQKMLEAEYKKQHSDTRVRPVKAGLSNLLRYDKQKRLYLPKSRAANDYHHAHDAYLAVRIGSFIDYRHPEVYDDVVGYAKKIDAFIAAHKNDPRYIRYLLNSAPYFINSFFNSGFDEQTGEIERDEWNARLECERILFTFGLKDCYISKMPQIDDGAFWDQTIYSPRINKTLVPLKTNMDTNKYGGYSRAQFAYFYVYSAKNVKNGKRIIDMGAVPVSLLNKIKGDKNCLLQYTKENLGDQFDSVKIIRPIVYKQQLIEVGNDRFYVTGIAEMRNARQISFDTKQYSLIKLIEDDNVEDASIETVVNLFSSIVKKMKLYSPELCKRLKYGSFDVVELFSQLDNDIKYRILLDSLAIFNSAKNAISTVEIGGTANSGRIKITYKKLFESNKVTFIDQSVTGMFERKQTIEI